jgi:hypothetical protein
MILVARPGRECQECEFVSTSRWIGQQVRHQVVLTAQQVHQIHAEVVENIRRTGDPEFGLNGNSAGQAAQTAFSARPNPNPMTQSNCQHHEQHLPKTAMPAAEPGSE